MLRRGPVNKAGLLAGGLLVLGGAILLGLQGCGSGISTAAVNSFAAASSASTPGVTAPPALGFGWDATDHSLRPILGIVGSSRIGSSVAPAGAYAFGAASPASQVALLLHSDGSVDRMALPATTVLPVAGVTAPANAHIRFAPSGNAALLFAVGGSTITVLSGLTATPQVSTLHSASALLDAAVSDNGTVAVLQQQGTGGQLAVLSASSARTVGVTTGTGSLAFLAKGDDLLLTDTGGNSLLLARSVSTATQLTAVPTASLLKSPVAVGGGSSGRWVVVANGADASVTRIDLSGVSTPLRITCPLTPTTVEQLAGDASFRFSSIGNTPAWAADMTAQNPTMLFVPAVPGT